MHLPIHDENRGDPRCRPRSDMNHAASTRLHQGPWLSPRVWAGRRDVSIPEMQDAICQ